MAVVSPLGGICFSILKCLLTVCYASCLVTFGRGRGAETRFDRHRRVLFDNYSSSSFPSVTHAASSSTRFSNVKLSLGWLVR